MNSLVPLGRPRRRSLIPCLTLLLLFGCGDSATDIEQPSFKNGASPDLAIELPPLFLPAPKKTIVVTEFSVISSGTIWFRNTTEDEIALKMIVSEPRTGLVAKVGTILLKAFQVTSMRLDATYTTPEFRDSDWTLDYRQGGVVKTIIVAIG